MVGQAVVPFMGIHTVEYRLRDVYWMDKNHCGKLFIDLVCGGVIGCGDRIMDRGWATGAVDCNMRHLDACRLQKYVVE